jgi:hypothetical protein
VESIRSVAQDQPTAKAPGAQCRDGGPPLIVLISVVATVVQTIVVLLGVRFAITSLRQSEASRNLEVIKALIDSLSSPEGYAERYAILDRGKVNPAVLSREDHLLYLRVCDHFQRISFLARQEFMSGDYLIRMFSATLVSIWGCVEEFVNYMRTQKGLSNFAVDFEWFASESASYRRKHFPGEALCLAIGPAPCQRSPAIGRRLLPSLPRSLSHFAYRRLTVVRHMH